MQQSVLVQVRATATEIFVINGVDGSQLAKDQNAYHSGSNPSVWIDMTSIIENGTLTTIAMKPVNGVSNPGIMTYRSRRSNSNGIINEKVY